MHIKRRKVSHSGLLTLLPLRHFGTIKHVSGLYIQQAGDDIIAENKSLPHNAFEMDVRFFCKPIIPCQASFNSRTS